MQERKKKVLLVLGDPTGGIRKHVHELLSLLDQQHFELHYFHGKTVDLAGKNDLTLFKAANIRCTSLKVPKRPHLLDVKNIYILRRYCVREKIDIIHGHGAKGGLYARLVGLLTKTTSVYTPHGGSIHSSFGFLQNFLYRLVEFAIKPTTGFFLFESNYTYKNFTKMAGPLNSKNFLVNYNGINCKITPPVRKWSDGMQTEVNILVAGALRPIKGQSISIYALKDLAHESRWNFRLHFCGDGPDKVNLISLTAKLGLSDRVLFHGEVEDVSQWYEKCSLVVVPSLFESFGYVAIEAGLMKRPVIAANVGGLQEIVQDNVTGRLFPQGNSGALAAKIIDTLHEESVTDTLVDAADISVRKHFDIETMLQNVSNTYKCIAE
jgi:glycosyltransferase involved in cell wall biosynthesis